MEEYKHDWYMFDRFVYGDYTCHICYDLPSPQFIWYRQCKLCNKLESFTLIDGEWTHKEEKQGIPI